MSEKQSSPKNLDQMAIVLRNARLNQPRVTLQAARQQAAILMKAAPKGAGQPLRITPSPFGEK